MGITEIASLVCGDKSAPPWLEPRLRQMSKRIRAYEEAEASAPKRTEMRERLDRFAHAIMEVREGLSDMGFVNFIGHDWSDLPSTYHDTMVTLEALGNRAHVVSNRFAGRAGAVRAYPTDADEAISAKQLCAWTIMQAMIKAGGLKVVAADNDIAWNATNELYQLSGGIALAGKNQPDGTRGEPSGWREHIVDVQHIMVESSRRGEAMRELAGRFTASVPPGANEL